jgi:hypothetical protein
MLTSAAMRCTTAASLSRILVLGLLPLVSACLDTERVTAVAESEQPFVIPGVDEPVCLVRVKERFGSKRREKLEKFKVDVHHSTTVAVAPGTAIVVDGKRHEVPEGNDGVRALLRSGGWAGVEFEYRWQRDDPDRQPPSEVVIDIAMHSDSLRGGVLQAICDGNGNCVGGKEVVHELDHLEWNVEVIPCGVEFEYAMIVE